ncbi:MAG: ABC transporter ATP-binding protein [Kosmotogaceae bacterium]
MNETALIVKDFNLYIDNERILKDISFSILEGQIVLFYGSRSSGKSMLLRTLLHLNEELFENVYGDGIVEPFGMRIENYDRKELRNDIAYVDTSFLTAIRDFSLKEFFRLIKGNNFSFEDLSDYDLDLIKSLHIEDILSYSPKTSLNKLLPYQRILLLIYSTLARNPSMVILDSIVDHLDDESTIHVKNMIYQSKSDRTVLLSSRYSLRLLDICDLLISLKDGKISYVGTPENYVVS